MLKGAGVQTDDTAGIGQNGRRGQHDPDTTYTEQFQVRIKTLEPDGEINPREQLHSFMADWLAPITDRLVAQYAPSTASASTATRRYSTRSTRVAPFPNTDMRGLAPAQQHAVAAAATRLDKRYQDAQDAIIVGEMGIGKTLCGPATAICIQAARTLVLCPPHLVQKWQREIRHVVPWAQVLVLKTIADVDTFFTQPASVAEPVFGVLKRRPPAAHRAGTRLRLVWPGAAATGQAGSPAQATAASALVSAFWERRRLPKAAG